MRDADVRFALLRDLAARFEGDANTRIVQEMGIWSGSVRVDVAVINGRLHGYEIKSAKDTLHRLDDQLSLYNQVFDEVTLVVADKHYYKASRKIPKWWGISIAVPQSDGTISIRKSRHSKPNANVVPLQLARLLWRSELLEILGRHDDDRGVRRGTSEVLALRLAQSLSLLELQAEVRNALKARTGWLPTVCLRQEKDADLRKIRPTEDGFRHLVADLSPRSA